MDTLLGGLSPQQFLNEYWQKKPLLIRQALPNFHGLFSANVLKKLATQDDVEARLVEKRGRYWQLHHGPFDLADLANLPTVAPRYTWSLLVQGVNQHLTSADALLQQFRFIPYTRLDDVMVSLANQGGGVGAHFDSYDVFLLQGSGVRWWRIGEIGDDLSLQTHAPLKLLKHFKTAQSWRLYPGDMLYLPPAVPHWGIAKSANCMTYSIGFRAPQYRELASEFLNFLQDKLADVQHPLHGALVATYQDPTLQATQHPAQIADDMLLATNRALNQLRWSPTDVAEFLGGYLTTPKAHIVFQPQRMRFDRFQNKLSTQRLVLDPKTLFLYWQDNFFINGEPVQLLAQMVFKHFADQRWLPPSALPSEDIAMLYDWYKAGFVRWA